MRMLVLAGTAAIFLVAVRSVSATLIVDPPLPITHRVQVQIIQTALDDGSQPATVFGNGSQQASVASAIDSIWAQAGVDIQFLPDVIAWADTFSYQGNGGGSRRPQSDLGAIIDRAASEGGILHASPLVINMFFVDIVPDFDFTSENSANGIAWIGTNGIAQFVGDNLFAFQNGRDVIGGVVAHEIGHNLGLFHSADGGANLMSPSGTSEQLTQAQIDTVSGSGFRQRIGDLDGDADVDFDDIDDFVEALNDPQGYENTFGVSPAGRGDIDLDGDHDFDDIGAFVQLLNAGVAGLTVVPEPSTLCLVGLAGLGVLPWFGYFFGVDDK